MSKLFFLICSVIFLNAGGIDYWDHIYTHKLKKDQVATVMIQKDQPSRGVIDSNLSFRWTLFKNSALIVLANYEGFATQYTLYQKRKRDNVRIDLDSYTTRLNRPYLLLQFSDFDPKTEVATIETYIKDPTKTIRVKWLKKEK